jgi:GntR family transcriptional regulator
VARALALEGGEAAVQIRRLLLAAEPGAAGQGVRLRPVVFDDLWLPGSLFRGLTVERLESWRGPMYRMFEAEFSVRMIRAEEKLRAVAATADDAALLEVPAGAPLLSVERLSFTYGDRPVELRRGLYHTARHHYRNELG